MMRRLLPLLLPAMLLGSAAVLAQDTPPPGEPAKAAGAGRSNPKNPVFLPFPEPVLDSFKKPDVGVDPKVWQLIDAAQAETIKARQAKIPRHIDMVTKVVPTAKPDQPTLVQSSIDFKALENGFLLVSGSGGADRTDREDINLIWMGLMLVYSRAHITVHAGVFLREGSLTKQLTTLNRFDVNPDALAPGATFAFGGEYGEKSYAHDVHAFTSSPKTVEGRVSFISECTVGERVPATEVFAEFTGTALKISCAIRGLTANSYYLEDYAWFISRGDRLKDGYTETKITGIVQ